MYCYYLTKIIVKTTEMRGKGLLGKKTYDYDLAKLHKHMTMGYMRIDKMKIIVS